MTIYSSRNTGADRQTGRAGSMRRALVVGGNGRHALLVVASVLLFACLPGYLSYSYQCPLALCWCNGWAPRSSGRAGGQARWPARHGTAQAHTQGQHGRRRASRPGQTRTGQGSRLHASHPSHTETGPSQPRSISASQANATPAGTRSLAARMPSKPILRPPQTIKIKSIPARPLSACRQAHQTPCKRSSRRAHATGEHTRACPQYKYM